MGETLAIPADRDVGAPAPKGQTDKFEERTALTGVGQSRVGRRLMVDPLRLTVDACLAAVADAGLTLDDIDGLSTYPSRVGSPGFSEGGIAPLTEALQLRPTWINGAGDTPGQSGAIVAAMLAVASGLCRHVLCYRTLWESSYAALVREGRWDAAGRPRDRDDRVPGPVRGDVGRELDRRAGVALLPPLRRRPHDARLDRGQRPRQRRPQSGGGLPRAVHHRRLPRRPAGDHAVRALRLRRAGRRRRRGDRLRDRDRRRPAPAAGAGRGGRHPDPGTPELGPGHAVARAADQGTVPAPVEPDQRAAGTRSTSRCCTTASPSTRSPGSSRSGSASRAAPATSSTPAAASPSAGGCRSTRTADSCRPAGCTGSGTSGRRCCSSGVRLRAARCRTHRSRW